MADIALHLSSTRPNLTTLRRLEVSSSEEHKLTVFLDHLKTTADIHHHKAATAINHHLLHSRTAIHM